MAFLLLLSFLLMLYASPALLAPGLDDLRPAQLAGIGAMTILVAQKALGKDSWRFSWPDSYLMPWLIAGAGLSSLNALWPKLAFDTTIDMLKIAVIYYLVLNCVDSEKRLRYTIAVLIAGGMFPAAGALFNYVRGIVIDGRAGWVGSYANPNDLAYSLVILIPLAWQMIPRAPWIFKPALLAILGTYFAAIMVSRSRGGVISAFAVLLILGFRQPGAVSKIAAAVLVVMLLAGVSIYWTRDVGFQDLNRDFTLYQRIVTIQAGWQMFVNNPLFGVGVGCSLLGWPLYAPPNLDFRGALVIHNTLVQSLAEVGLVGFIPLVLLLASALMRVRRIIQKHAPGGAAWSYAVALEASLVGYLVCGLSGGYLTSWFPYILIALVSAVAILTSEDGGFGESQL